MCVRSTQWEACEEAVGNQETRTPLRACRYYYSSLERRYVAMPSETRDLTLTFSQTRCRTREMVFSRWPTVLGVILIISIIRSWCCVRRRHGASYKLHAQHFVLHLAAIYDSRARKNVFRRSGFPPKYPTSWKRQEKLTGAFLRKRRHVSRGQIEPENDHKENRRSYSLTMPGSKLQRAVMNDESK